ncbi:sugar phosphate isomerase/epimerase family protein [Phytohalomonas tamaricis]|uniref:sugar phosphate isomerase/epimerase family protein n=1 Tax=Phytohalomonas tamaricis TaxID=2081032 RepID=UPI000D0AE35E|nr:sugar phosphate isomerase/epimerase family protein [Phytohalomonas tamaricis]
MDKLGICTWTLGIDDLHALMSKIKTLGLDGVQFCADGRQYQAEELRACVDEQGLELFAIDPFDCAPDDPEKASAEGAIAYYREVIDFAAASGAPAVTLQGLGQWTTNCDSDDEAWQRLVECCKALVPYAQKHGITPMYEVVNRYEMPLIRTAAEGRRLVAEVGDELGLIPDSFHMNIDEADPCQALRDSAEWLVSYHISDSNRAGIGSGHINFPAQHRVLRQIGFSGPVMIEPVLPPLTPTTTPRSAAERDALDDEIHRSVATWRALG